MALGLWFCVWDGRVFRAFVQLGCGAEGLAVYVFYVQEESLSHASFAWLLA